jgi:hypothetical protein
VSGRNRQWYEQHWISDALLGLKAWPDRERVASVPKPTLAGARSKGLRRRNARRRARKS